MFIGEAGPIRHIGTRFSNSAHCRVSTITSLTGKETRSTKVAEFSMRRQTSQPRSPSVSNATGARINRFRHQPWLVAFALQGELRLLDITDTFPVRAGASSKLATGPYSHAQNWSRGFYDAYPAIQGIYYRSSLTGRPAIALYERARSAGVFPRAPRFHRALGDPALLDALRIVVEEDRIYAALTAPKRHSIRVTPERPSRQKPPPHLIVRGTIIEPDLVEFAGRGGGCSFRTPDVHRFVDQLPLRGPGNFKDIHALKTEEIIDFLVGFGERLDVGANPHLQQARELSYDTAPVTRPILDDEYEGLKHFYSRELLEDMIEAERPYFDGWVRTPKPNGRVCSIRAFGARSLHIVAGNSPLVSAMTIARSALTRGDAIIKSPSNDPFTAAAVVRSLCEYAPDHPVTKHLSVAYWKGGDESFERRFYLPANIEKILAWGGFASVEHVTKYIQPGLELISLDPKRSISVIGAETFEADESLRVAILGAEGDRIFCSGNDFRYASEHKRFEIPPTGLAGLTSRFTREKPIIAAVNGAAAGGGFEIAMACDLVVAARHATFSLPELKAGTYAGAGGLIRLPRQVGDKIAMEMILTGRKISAERACALGLVNHVVEEESLMGEARQLAAEIVENSPLACAISKRIVNETRGIPALRDAQEVSNRLGAQLIRSKEFRRGVSAFLEKRRPDWTAEES